MQVAIYPMRTSRFRRSTPWNEKILDVVTSHRIHVLAPDEPATTQSLVLRQPGLIPETIRMQSLINAHRVHVVANQSQDNPVSPYRAEDVDQLLQRATGVAPIWHPIDTTIRSEVESLTTLEGRVFDYNWLDYSIRQVPPHDSAVDWLGMTVLGFRSELEDLASASAARQESSVRLWVASPDITTQPDWETVILGALQNGTDVVLPSSAADRIHWDGLTFDDGNLAKVLQDYGKPDGAFEKSKEVATLRDSFYRTALARRLGVSAKPATSADGADVSRDELARRPVVMFMTSNGAGMGHLTRELGIARAIADRAEPVFVSLSQGVPVVSQFGFSYEYVPFRSALRNPPGEWNDYCDERISRAIETHQPEVVVFDGVWPYGGLVRAIRRAGVRSVWVRRGMWKPHITPEQLEKAHPFDLVIEPGDYAAEKDRGATTKVDGAVKVAPITVISKNEILGRDEARAELELPAHGRLALVTLGAGNINDIADVQRTFVSEIEALGPEWKAVTTSAPISEKQGRDTGFSVSVFPLARYANAFDFAVSATGYNSFHEWITAGLPTIWVPNQHTITDDQAARGEFAGESGLGITLQDPTELAIRESVLAMSSSHVRSSMSERADDIVVRNGSHTAADAIVELLRRYR
ncbi:UDP-N-acetylglucosamine:LPS N-acetylglucosamine transferase [Isoptericola sp. CG 20/1183]|uniref:UDP-N-acetylglucosamine:LPS N-acetylglucosamine transferase n=2 Tax=Promicromonosporaceae TaxID=85017 RepID=A0ABX5EHF9_9MICO|nr:UDP-N-acetylglucosamine:LPS N-acetylglucosamine transferase [Isoptericola halotolerans]PRZ08909.1 UDP-N-acetylglucosamine:LPS N-acetylglucosamine transferase [Isoptericola sp. CG 20/1183]